MHNKVKNNNSTSCPKIGIKIHESNNDYKTSPFQINVNKNNNRSNYNNSSECSDLQNTENFDLNIDNYSMNDIFHLFNIQNQILTEDIMKESKKFVLKTHPDKSKLPPKYFLFYSSAYKKLYSIFEFQNKSTRKKIDQEDYVNESNNKILDNVFTKNEDLKDPKNFNDWFNKKFEQYKIDGVDDNNKGYGDWLKTNEGIIDTSNVAKADMNNEFEKYKKQAQTLTVYNGVNDMSSAFFGTNIVSNQNNFTSGGLFQDGLGFTDLKQAYEESVIPVTAEDYDNIPKYKDLNDYKNRRESDNTSMKVVSKEEAMKKLYEQQKREEDESVSLAFQLAKQNEEVQKKQKSFWGELQQITGW
jgi:hypothetical protein